MPDLAALQRRLAALEAQVAQLGGGKPVSGDSAAIAAQYQVDASTGGVTEVSSSPVGAQGDLIAGNAAGEEDRLAVGVANAVPVADPAAALGIRWVPLNEYQDMLTGATEQELGGEVGEQVNAYEAVTFDPEEDRRKYQLAYTAASNAEVLIINAAALADIGVGEAFELRITVEDDEGNEQVATAELSGEGETEGIANRYEQKVWIVNAPKSGTVTLELVTTTEGGEPIEDEDEWIERFGGFIQLVELLGDGDEAALVFSDEDRHTANTKEVSLETEPTAAGVAFSYVRRRDNTEGAGAPDASESRSGTRILNYAFTTPANSFNEDIRVEVMVDVFSAGGLRSDDWTFASAEGLPTDGTYGHAETFNE